MEAVQRATRKTPEELQQPSIPSQAKYLLHWLDELCGTRGSNGFGKNPISYLEIQAWAAMTDRKLTQWEISTIRILDREVING